MSEQHNEQPAVAANSAATAPAQSPVQPPAANAAKWRKRRHAGAWRTTQSGLAVRVRRLSLVEMVISGEMPKPLQADAEKLVASDVPVIDAVRKHLDVIRAAVRIGVIEPRIVEGDVRDDDDSAVSITELSIDDLIQIYTEITSVRGGLLPHQMLAFLETE
jgi:hypothetical protein